MEQQTKNCPYCGEEILAVAKKCKHCGEWLETKEEKETAPAVSAEATPKLEATPVSQPATEKPASEVAPSETYYESSTKKIVVGAITAVLVILTIWLFVSPPKIEFDYIFDTIPYGIIFMALSVFAVFYFATLFDEKRTSRIYLNSNGDLDIETPREYKPLSVSPVSWFLGRENKFMQKNLDYFKYQDGRVLIRNSKGHEIEGALSDLTYTYQMTKNKMTDEWYIYKYIITDANGNKVQFNQHNSLFTDEEYADIEMLLSLAGTVKESKVSKFTRKADSILSAISDLDFSNLASSAVELVGSTATSKITNAAGLVAKKRIFDRLSDKKKSLFARIKEYGIWIVIAIIALVLIWVNITNAMEAYGGTSEESTEYNYDQDNSDSDDSSDNESTEIELNNIDSDESDAEMDDEFKVLSERNLSESDLYGMSKKELEIMRNSIYARHGYRFKRDDLANFFSQFSWYYPVTSDMSAVYMEMSDIEKYNIEFIKKHE